MTTIHPIKRLPDIIVLSHLRWKFVLQRPQHLLSRFAGEARVFFFEEPSFYDRSSPALLLETVSQGVHLLVPQLPKSSLDDLELQRRQLGELITGLVAWACPGEYLLWYYTPAAVPFTQDLNPVLVVYDCMDELSAFAGASNELQAQERQLLAGADVVFTGGQSLYEAKRNLHPNVHPFPSTIDVQHFGLARRMQPDPADQAHIPRPRIGFYGIIDERLDFELVREIAALRPDWQFVLIGPVVKIDRATLPTASNLHYLGKKEYDELPRYLSGWDIAMMPFARNESTRFISPAKTPEFLAGGRPVVSTSIKDVVNSYGELNLVHIADEPADFVIAIESALAQRTDEVWAKRVERHLDVNSWDRTYAAMKALMLQSLAAKQFEHLRPSGEQS